MLLGSFEAHPVQSVFVFYGCQSGATAVKYFTPPANSKGAFQTPTQSLTHCELGHIVQFMEL